MKFGLLSDGLPFFDDSVVESLPLEIVEAPNGLDAWIEVKEGAPVIFVPGGMELRFNWDSGPMRKRLSSIGKKQPLFKAINLEKNTEIVDLTFGRGVDSLCLLKLGACVQAIERNPLLYLLGIFEISRLIEMPEYKYLKNLTLKFEEAKSLLLSKTPMKGKTVYYDPMYPEKSKSSLPKKELQIMAQICGSKGDRDEIFELVRQSGAQRFVLKRPHFVSPYKESLNFSVESKLVRYDVYLF